MARLGTLIALGVVGTVGYVLGARAGGSVYESVVSALARLRPSIRSASSTAMPNVELVSAR